MGLAPYGNSSPTACEYIQKIKSQLIDIREDGSFLLNMDYFDYATGLTMTNSQAWEKLLAYLPVSRKVRYRRLTLIWLMLYKM